MGKPVVYGADYSVYVRIVRLVLEEKGIDYELVPVDIFRADGIPGWYFDHHPFGRIPAFEHDGFRLYEIGAIDCYVDEAFDGPRCNRSRSGLARRPACSADHRLFRQGGRRAKPLSRVRRYSGWARIVERPSFARAEKAG
jgi:glutathione S-transferase